MLYQLSSTFFFFNDTATTEIYTLSLHDALPICPERRHSRKAQPREQDQLVCSLRSCASAGKYRERRSCGLLCISVVIYVASILHGNGILSICGPVVVVRFLNARFGLCAPSLFGLVSMTGMADRANHRDFSSIPIQSASC